MGQKFIIVRSKLTLSNESSIYVNLFEWADLTLFGDDRNEYHNDYLDWITYRDELTNKGEYYFDLSLNETDERGDSCECFIFPKAPEIHPVAPFIEKWAPRFAADPNVEYAGSIYKYLRDV